MVSRYSRNGESRSTYSLGLGSFLGGACIRVEGESSHAGVFALVDKKLLGIIGSNRGGGIAGSLNCTLLLELTRLLRSSHGVQLVGLPWQLSCRNRTMRCGPKS